MKKKVVFNRYLFAIRCCLLAMCLLSFPVYTETSTEQQIKISFIYNFAKFVNWPNIASATAPLVICVIGSQPLARNIVLLQNKKVNERPIKVHFLSQDKIVGECDILFISESETPSLEKNLLPLTGLPILTISTIPDFVQAGGMIGLKVSDNRVRFDVNLVAAQKAGLSVNSQLSNLADEVVQ